MSSCDIAGQLSGMEELWPEFAQNRLFLGGDVGKSDGRNVMQLIHASQAISFTTPHVRQISSPKCGGC